MVRPLSSGDSAQDVGVVGELCVSTETVRPDREGSFLVSYQVQPRIGVIIASPITDPEKDEFRF